jgi:hypothetical protein
LKAIAFRIDEPWQLVPGIMGWQPEIGRAKFCNDAAADGYELKIPPALSSSAIALCFDWLAQSAVNQPSILAPGDASLCFFSLLFGLLGFGRVLGRDRSRLL